jgi:DNA-binding transcriptional LysR family regulator
MDIRHLRYFLAVADEQSFSRAAQKMHIAQPPLSQQVKQLEDELGVLLFDRDSRPVKLTSAGRFLASHVRPILAELNDLKVAVGRMGRGEVGVLGVAFIGSATISLLPTVLREFREQYPDVLLNLYEMNFSEQQQALLEGRIDAGFTRPAINDPKIECIELHSEPLVVAVPKGHRLALKEKIALPQLRAENFVSFPRTTSGSYGAHIYEICRKAGFEPEIVQEANELQTLLSLVASGIGIGIVPELSSQVRKADLVYLNLKKPAPKTSTSLVYRKDDDNRLLSGFIKVVFHSLKYAHQSV